MEGLGPKMGLWALKSGVWALKKGDSGEFRPKSEALVPPKMGF